MASSDISRALQQFPYGLYLVGSSSEKLPILILANWLSQVSFDPPMLAVSIENDSKMHASIKQSGYFSAMVLPGGEPDLARSFLKSRPPDGDTVSGRRFQMSAHGTPLIDDANAWLECRVTALHPAGDHTLILGRVEDAKVNRDGTGLTLKDSGLSYRRERS